MDLVGVCIMIAWWMLVVGSVVVMGGSVSMFMPCLYSIATPCHVLCVGVEMW